MTIKKLYELFKTSLGRLGEAWGGLGRPGADMEGLATYRYITMQSGAAWEGLGRF